MAMTDPIADLLTRIRNAQLAGHETLSISTSRLIDNILSILKKEGFINKVIFYKEGIKRFAKINLKYYQGKPVIRHIERVSKPSRRVYVNWKKIQPVLNNFGVSILSTSKGIVSNKEAKMLHVGGEIICKVW